MADHKLPVLARLSSYMGLKQRKILMKNFIEAQFSCYPLVWVFYGKILTRKINQSCILIN